MTQPQKSMQKRICPNCSTNLENVQIKHGVIWSCFACKGRAIGMGLLKKISDPEIIQQVWMRAQESKKKEKPCPACRRPMAAVSTGPDLGSVELDVCHACYFIWFDDKELDKVPKASNREIRMREAANEPKIRRDPNDRISAYDDYGYDDGGMFDIADLLDAWIRWRR